LKLFHKIYGSGPPLIILHGLFGLGDNWRTIARKLESEFQCIVVDLRNHGRSPHDGMMNWNIMVEDVHELIADLDLDDVFLLGHSMGGKVAMQFATTYPEIVDKLIVVDIAPKQYMPHHDQVIQAIQSLDPASLSGRDEAEGILRSYLGPDEATVQFLMKNISRLPEGGFVWKSNMPVILNAYQALMDDISFMHPYLGPVLFIRGEQSSYIEDEDLAGIHQLFPEATLVTVPGAGHWVHADQPDAFARITRDFLIEH
jgi:pimeloyl-ACP methyl ester carboxylesterase